MNYELPTSLNVSGTYFDIRWDFRAALDIFAALNDIELDEFNRAMETLEILYVDFESIPSCCWQEALNQAFWFLNGGTTEKTIKKKEPQLVSWEQDLPYIIAPINRVLGFEVRRPDKQGAWTHWWTFLSAYNEIGGDCTFSQIVRIRDHKARGKKLEKSDAEWYRKNRDIVDIKQQYTESEKEWLSNILGKPKKAGGV